MRLRSALNEILSGAIRTGLLVTISLLLIACGKKGPPTLKSYEKPPSPSLVRVFHREGSITVSWSFPEKMEESIAEFIILKSEGPNLEKINARSNLRSYADSDFREGKIYRYRLVSKSQKGVLSIESNTIQITPELPPDAPQDFGFELGDDAVILKWKSAGSNILYNVYRSSEKGIYGFVPVNAAPLTETAFRDSISLDKKFSYTVRGLRKRETGDEGPPSSEIVIDPFEFIPPAPQDLGYYAAPEKVFLYWAALPQSWITGYRVYRRTGNEDFTLVGVTQIPTFVDNEAPLVKRDYRVTAIGPAKEGPSAEIDGVVFIPGK